MINWFSEAELERDRILLELPEVKRLRLKKAIKEAEANIERFPEIGKISRLNPLRPDVRELLVGKYRLVYIINHPDDIWVLGFVPPGSSQALD